MAGTFRQLDRVYRGGRTYSRLILGLLILGWTGTAIAQQYPFPRLMNPPAHRPVKRKGATAQGLIAAPSNSPAPDFPAASAASWTPFGPAALNDGDHIVSGRISGTAVDPTDPNVIYVAASGGGVWKTTDGGSTWNPLTDSQPTLSMGAIAIAPSNHLRIYAGTGEANNALDSNYGLGIMASSDGGATWLTSTGPLSVFTRMSVSKISVDPIDENTVYAAFNDFNENSICCSNTGIYKSTDGGITWTNVTGANGKESFFPWSDVAVDPNNNSIIYAAHGDPFPAGGDTANGVYRSTDSGATWSLLTNAPSGSAIGRISIAVAPSANAAGHHVLYIAVANPIQSVTGATLFEIVRSDNADAATPTFTVLPAPNPFGDGAQGWYDNIIGVDPANSANVYVAGALTYATNTNAVIRSINSGASWIDITKVGALQPHTDSHAMAFDSLSRMVLGNDGGVYRFDPSGGTSWTDLNGNLNTIQLTGIGLHPTSTQTIVGGSQDNGTELSTGTAVWTEVDGGDGGYTQISQTNPLICYANHPIGSFGLTQFFRVSTDGCNTFSSVTPPIPQAILFKPTEPLTQGAPVQNPNLFNFYAPIFVDPSNGERVFLAGDAVYESPNHGGSWTRHTSPSTTTPINSVAVLPGGNVIYISTGGTLDTTSPQIWVSIDDGASWNPRNLPVGGAVQEIDIDPNDATGNTAVAVINTFNGTSGQVYRTTNMGVTWTNISGSGGTSIPSLPAWSAKIDTDANHTLYVSNEIGVYSSPSPYGVWTSVGSGLPHAQGVHLELNSSLHLLALATHGRGAWYISTTVALASPTISKVFSPTTIQSGGNSTVTLTLTNSNVTPVTGGAFTDTLVKMSALGGSVTGTCVGTTPNSLTGGATALSFTGITIPASTSCTIIFSVTSSTPGVNPNSTSGVTTTQTPAAGAGSNTANLTVLAAPTIAKAFSPTSIPTGANSTVTLTLANSNASALTGGAFSDTLAKMSAVGGAVGGTCTGTTPSTLGAGATALAFTGITIPASSSCTVTFSVTSSTVGADTNVTSGVTTTQTPTAGTASNTATLTVTALSAATISKAFSPTTIQSGASSTVTLTLGNTNTSTLTGGSFSDTLANMSAAGGSVTGTCVGTTPNTLTGGATALSFSGITIPASGSCTVIFSVTSTTAGAQPNTTSGVTTTQTAVGSASNTATLTVLAAPTISKAFSPTSIPSGSSSTVTLTLANSNASALTGGAFSDTLAKMSAVGGAVGGTCAGTTPSTLSAGATALAFTGITIPASSSCTVTFSVTSSTVGADTNVTSGVTTTQTPTAGAASNTATLTVTALSAATISKAFSPTTIQSGASSTVTLTLGNTNTSTLTGGSFSDTLANMSAAGGSVTGTCVGTTPNTLTGGATALSFSGITIPASGSCTVIFSVTSTTAGAQPNTTSGVTTTQTAVGSASNTATLTVLAAPTISKAFSPTSIPSGSNSTVTLTLANSNASALTGGAFSDTLAKMTAVGGAVGGTCAGTTPSTLSAGATALAFTGITIPASSSCTVTFSVTSSTVGADTNVTSGVTTTQTPTAGTASNTATLTVTALSAATISKAFSPTTIQSGASSTVTLTLGNTNTSTLTGGSFSDTLANMSAAGGSVTGTCVGTTPNSLTGGATALSFSGITIPASGSCTVIFSVTSSTPGAQPNTTSGVTTTQTAVGSASNTATLTVLAAPTISKAFSPTSIPSGANSTVTLTLANSNASALTGGAFSDTLAKMSATGGAVGGTCAGTTPSTLSAGATALAFTAITIPASSSCTVTFSVTSSTVGADTNVTTGVTTTQTPTAGTASNTATLTVTALSAATISKAFSPTTIQSGANSTVTLTLGNTNTSTLTGGSFSDTLANMSAAGGSVTGTCVGTTPNSLTGGATALTFSGITIPASGSCTVIFSVTSSTPGAQPNTTSGVTTTQTAVGSASNTATLTVLTAPTIAKAFSPTSIPSGANSTVTLTLANSNASALTGGAFSDTLAKMSATGGAVGGTCAGTTPSTLSTGATALAFTAITIPASSSCTVTFSVTSSTLGVNPNTTSGVTTTQTTTAGTGSNTENLTVTALAAATISKSFTPATIQSGGSSTVTLTLGNTNTSSLTGGSFSDTLANMSAAGGSVAGTCVGTTPNTLTGGATALSFSGITIPASGSCTVIFSVTSSTPGAQPNTTSGVTTTQTAVGSASNTATLTVLAAPTISKAFGPTSIPSGSSSTVTLTLANSNASALTGGAFSDTLVNMSAAGGAVGGTCAGTTPSTLTTGATALAFTAITIPASSSCTVTFSVTSSTLGVNPNTTSGVTSTQTTTSGAASNTANLTVTALASPTISKAFSPATIDVGGASTVTLTLSNTNGSALTGGAFTDTLVNMSAVGGALTGTCAGTTPGSLTAGQTALSFTGITIPANASCTVIFSVTSSAAGSQPNTTSGVTTTQTPAAGAASNTAVLTVNNLATVTNVTSSTADGTYGAGAVVSVQVTFSAAVSVTGTPLLALNSGGTASYNSGSGTSTLNFTYTVAAGQNSSHLDYTSATALALNGGTIKDASNTPATLTLPAPGAAGSLGANKNIVINTTPATVTNVTSSTADGTYGAGAVISIQVTFSAAVSVTGTPLLALNSGGTASYNSGSGTSTLNFTYTVAAGQNSSHLDYTSATALALNGGTIKDASNTPATLTLPAPGAAGSLGANKNIVISTTPATVTNVTSSTANGTYGAGAVISVQVTFSAAVSVTGTPLLALNSGGTASYGSGSGTSTLNFTYTVAAGQNSSHLDYTSATALALNGGTIKDASNTPATLTLPAPGAAGSLGANKNIVINTTPATVTNVTSSTANGTYGTGAVIPILVTFSASVNVTGTPLLALNSGGTASYSSGSGTSILTFTYVVAAGQNSAHLDYTSSSALTLNGGTISDASSTPANLTLPAPGAAGSLGGNKNIVIDTVAPTVVQYNVIFGTQTYNVAATPRNRLPWKITAIQVVFSKPVNATAASLFGLPVAGISGAGTNTVTWTLTIPLTNLPATLTKVLGTTANAVTDLAGNPLAGGTDFNQVVKVLYGDFNDDGVVNAQDLALVNNARSAPYNLFADLNGDGVVNVTDVVIVQMQLGNTNP